MTAVNLFIRKIPKGTSAQEIREFVESGVSWLSHLKAKFKYRLIRVKILTTLYGKTMEPQFHAIVTIAPDNIAENIISRLRFKQLRGQRVMVRRYYDRSDKNDRRGYQSKAEKEKFLNQRIRDRRIQVVMDFDQEKVKGSSRKLV